MNDSTSSSIWNILTPRQRLELQMFNLAQRYKEREREMIEIVKELKKIREENDVLQGPPPPTLPPTNFPQMPRSPAAEAVVTQLLEDLNIPSLMPFQNSGATVDSIHASPDKSFDGKKSLSPPSSGLPSQPSSSKRRRRKNTPAKNKYFSFPSSSSFEEASLNFLRLLSSFNSYPNNNVSSSIVPSSSSTCS